MGYLGATLTQVFTRARSQSRRVTQPEIGNGVTKCRWRHAPEARWGFWEFWRNLVELRLDTERDGWLSLARGGLGQVSHEIGGRWKSQDRKIMPLSPYVEKPLNSKVIKSFVLEQRSRKCFSCFEIPMFYLYGHSMYVWHIAISWGGYNITYYQTLHHWKSLTNHRMSSLGLVSLFDSKSNFVGYLVPKSSLWKNVVYSYADACRIITTTQWRQRHSSLEKYTPHFIERVVCERELETKQNYNILTPPHSYGHNSVSFPFSWAAQPGTWGPASLGHVPQSSIFSPTDWTSCAPSYVIVNLAIVVEGDPKAPFSTATTPKCSGGATPFLGLHHFTLDTYLILLSVKQVGINYHF